MIAWLTDNETKEDPTHAVTFAAPTVKLTSKFAALDEAGTVHVWGEKSTVQPTDSPDEDEAFEEAWNRYVPFGDATQRWPSRPPEALDYTPRSLPLPPIKKLATGRCYNVGISRAGQLFVWSYKSEKWPEIGDVNLMSAAEFRKQALRLILSAASRSSMQLRDGACCSFDGGWIAFGCGRWAQWTIGHRDQAV
ncbi:hypothetical protein Asppvi_009218 [Aspergillus pseudoviridinutans]|uniref:Regulator of chromosome condensation 1/beta-lactamase-inhibitor protein II n=1 Tax=Aspergillus pseudoviridinutans TaxID=1517512 RepID=A0A9P3EW01_9EURO|nr:uncharacterized protein Asppvi_009218 [Aspergillus pseudoviridinutans]GIJ90264.1 hypothetical protein Asppvi_009218 [Aspergillus pseudoviridinutans]